MILRLIWLMFVFLPLRIYEQPLVEIQHQPYYELTKDNVWEIIQTYPFHNPKLVMKSAIFESGHQFQAYNARVRQNIFGMHCSTRADTCDGLYTVYTHWWESIEDRWIHEQRHFKGNDYRRYIDRHWGIMDGTYCDYLDRIRI